MAAARLLSLALWLLAGAAAAQEPSFEAVAERYFAAETYCDAGKRLIDHGPPLNTKHGEAFERCAHRDGRFRWIENPGDRGSIVNWSDGEMHHRYFLYNKLYQHQSFTDGVDYDLYRNRSELYPVFLFRFLIEEPRELTEKARRTEWVRSFKPDAALSTPETTVFVRMAPPHLAGSERLYVRTKDKMIVRHEGVRNGTVVRTTELASAELNRPLGPADLSYAVPLYYRFSPQSNPKAFVAILFAVVLLSGFGAWGLIFARAADPQNVVDGRRLLWRIQKWAGILVAALLGILAVVTSIGPQSGHPPAIVFVFLLGILAAIGFGLVACFTLASYPVQWLRARSRT